MSEINGVDVEYLKQLVETVKKHPELGRTLWRARSKWKDGFKVEVNIRDFTIRMDEPKDLGGTNTAPNMVEFVLGALGACLVVGYVMNAAIRGIELDKVEIDVEGDIDLPGFFGLESPEKVSPGFTNIRARVFLKTKKPVSKEELKELHETVVKTSPVGNTLMKPVNLEVKLEERRTV
ncbi:OsmC family protein [Ferroglobus placidus DSM 10642]|uniref:OsmC family protein n=1 Tax=Ferroglobus placidus (strain DSM 10642 / AEDII12DO) TaxID=589924 RepID=D3RZJ0_FERPA|nr:OsmC family protein [Ferroglobus placidus]ADC65903.1 OsmC family protein [Ferroglobus placidus DSM 10642]